MDNFVFKTILEDIKFSIDNIVENPDDLPVKQYYAGKLSILSDKLLACICRE